jgi:hypothetical protein
MIVFTLGAAGAAGAAGVVGAVRAAGLASAGPAGGVPVGLGSAEAMLHDETASTQRIERTALNMPAACRSHRSTVHWPGGLPKPAK